MVFVPRWLAYHDAICQRCSWPQKKLHLFCTRFYSLWYWLPCGGVRPRETGVHPSWYALEKTEFISAKVVYAFSLVKQREILEVRTLNSFLPAFVTINDVSCFAFWLHLSFIFIQICHQVDCALYMINRVPWCYQLSFPLYPHLPKYKLNIKFNWYLSMIFEIQPRDKSNINLQFNLQL